MCAAVLLNSLFVGRESFLESILRKRPEELAPELGTVIKSLAEDHPEPRELLDPEIFLSRTYITQTYEEVLRDIFDTFSRGGTYVVHLNVEMGSGKTHLLTLLLHLFYILPKRGFQLISQTARDSLIRLRDLGFREDSASRTVVIAADLRSSSFKEVLELLLKSLERAGCRGARRLLEERLKDVELAKLEAAKLGRELAENLDEDKHVLVILDELFYTALRDIILAESESAVILEFIEHFVEIRRKVADQRKSALVVLIASAREDYVEWQNRKSQYYDRKFYQVVERLLKYVSRVHSGRGTYEWVSEDEALKVVRRWLGVDEQELVRYIDKVLQRLREQLSGFLNIDKLAHELKVTAPFTPAIRWLARKVLAPSPDSDLPHAQHLRGLIKVAAHLVDNARREGVLLASPAHIDEACVRALLQDEAPIWLEHLARCYQAVDRLELSDHIRSMLKYAVNAVFTKSVTTRHDKITTLMRLEHTKSDDLIRKVIDLVADRDDLISALIGIVDIRNVDDVLRLLDAGYIPHITRIPAPSKVGGYGYTFILFENPTYLYRRYVEQNIEKYRRLIIEEPRKVIEEIDSFIRRRIVSSSDVNIILIDVHNKTLDNIVEEVVNRARAASGKLCVLLLNTWLLTKRECEDLIAKIREKLCEENPLSLLLTAIIVPIPDSELLKDLAVVYAHYQAIRDYISNYLQYPERIVSELIQVRTERGAESRRLHLELLQRYRDILASVIYNEVGDVLPELCKRVWSIITNSVIFYVDISRADRVPEVTEKSGRELGELSVQRPTRRSVRADELSKEVENFERNVLSTLCSSLVNSVGNMLNYTSDHYSVKAEMERWIEQNIRAGRSILEIVDTAPYIPGSIRTDYKTWRRAMESLSGWRKVIEQGQTRIQIEAELRRSDTSLTLIVKAVELIAGSRSQLPSPSPPDRDYSPPIIKVEGVMKILDTLRSRDLTNRHLNITLALGPGCTINISGRVTSRELQEKLYRVIAALVNLVDRDNASLVAM